MKVCIAVHAESVSVPNVVRRSTAIAVLGYVCSMLEHTVKRFCNKMDCNNFT
jgi:hypothetical protein